MSRRAFDGWAAGAALAALPVLLAPVGDPDLWWHLSAAEWMASRLDWPRADWLSFTLDGRPWADFEWLAQRVFHEARRAAGWGGLWGLKIALLCAAGAAVYALLKRRGVPAPARAAALALWSAAIIPRADIRTDLFSLTAFAWLLYALETGRHAPRARAPVLAAAAFAAFALWANLHAGFAYGLVLLGIYAAAELFGERRSWELSLAWAAGVLGALLNPYGPEVYGVLLSHAAEAGALREFIVEWSPLGFARPGHWPSWIWLGAAAGLLGWRWRNVRRLPVPVSAALLFFALAGLRHARLAAYFATAAAMLVPVLARVWGAYPFGAARLKKPALAALVVSAAFSIWCQWSSGLFRTLAHGRYVPAQAAAFLERNPELLGRRLYHAWGWGGYLGYRLAPRQRVFQDGRYLFHPLLAEAGEASRSPEGFGAFLDRHGIETALLENLPLDLPTERLYPDGGRRSFSRPYYLSYMPRERWALIYWDASALLFLRRGVLSEERLASLEYRYARPGDRAALEDALSRGEIDLGRLEAEYARHRGELEGLPRGPDISPSRFRKS